MSVPDIKAIGGQKQTFEDEPSMAWYILFLTKGGYLYCINESINNRKFYGKVDRIVSGWRIKTDKPYEQMKKSRKENMRGENSTIVDLSEGEMNIEWFNINRLLHPYLTEVDFELIDGSFDIEYGDKEQDPYALDETDFKELVFVGE